MRKYHFKWVRLLGMIVKEFIQMRRDRATFAMIIAIPIIQMILFGYAINTNPKHLPTVIVSSDYSNFTRSIIAGMQTSDYYDVVATVPSEKTAAEMLRTGDAQFVLNVPPDFSRNLVRGEHPKILLEADATDPATVGNAVGAIQTIVQNSLQSDLNGSLSDKIPAAPTVNVIVHALYNPTANTQYNIMPGLIGVILTMTLIMITAIAITRERERGTMENLLATPIQPLEIIIGKILPFIMVGYIQIAIILLVSHFLFQVPIQGSIVLFLLAILPFIAANLSMGLMLSTIAKNQLQSIQMGMFFFLPSLLLSGFMFPFRGMPVWAQYIGQCLPLTHFMKISRGILLKGNGWLEIWPQIWPILLFLLVVILIGLKRFRKTLD